MLQQKCCNYSLSSISLEHQLKQKTTTNMKKQELHIDLGFIGHKAEKLQQLFNGYSFEGNENGYFLRFENYSELIVNQGVTVWTNCFKSEKHFKEMLLSKLLFKL